MKAASPTSIKNLELRVTEHDREIEDLRGVTGELQNMVRARDQPPVVVKGSAPSLVEKYSESPQKEGEVKSVPAAGDAVGVATRPKREPVDLKALADDIRKTKNIKEIIR